jgi:ABC-type multidrug transport system fused ATPase/permease subunit
VLAKLEAERIQSFIINLNKRMQAYIDDFFPTEPLTVRLDCFREAKSGASKGMKKAQITFSMSYKDFETDDLGVLSGGEYDRLQLAVTLAFADCAKIPILMLDESLNSLDDQTCAHVVDKIRCKDRLTLLVAHQVSSEGVFDTVLKL